MKNREKEEREKETEEKSFEELVDTIRKHSYEVKQIYSLFLRRGWWSKRFYPSIFYKVFELIEQNEEKAPRTYINLVRLTPLAYRVLKDLAEEMDIDFWDLRDPYLAVIDAVAYGFPHLVGGEDLVLSATAGNEESIEELVENIKSNPKFWKIVKEVLISMVNRTSIQVDGVVIVPKSIVESSLSDTLLALAPIRAETPSRPQDIRRTIDIIENKIMPYVTKRWEKKTLEEKLTKDTVRGRPSLVGINKYIGRMEKLLEKEWIQVKEIRELMDYAVAQKKVTQKTLEVLGEWEKGNYVLPDFDKDEVIVILSNKSLREELREKYHELYERIFSIGLTGHMLDNLPEDILKRSRILWDIKRHKDAVKEGRISVDELEEIFLKFYAACAAAEEAHRSFLGRIEEFSQDGVNIPARAYEKHVYSKVVPVLIRARPRIHRIVIAK